MEETSFQDNLANFAKKNWLVLGLLIIGLIFVGVGLVQMTASKTTSVKFEKGIEVAGASAQTSGEIKVDVEGAVINPGVYTLKGDARVQDALIAAGGLSATANRKALNLAQKIADGMKIYVPAEGEAAVAAQSSVLSESTTSQAGLISVNNASQSELESLSGIGPVTAKKIIDNRPYAALEELVSKKALGKGTFDKLKDQITL